LFLERGSAMSVNQKLTWADYPAPRVKKVKGKYSIVVSVPRAIRHLFGTPEVAKATGTTDRAIAEKKLIPLGNELYAKLDQKQIDAERATFDEVDLIAIEAITTFANAIRYRGGRIPPLVAETEYTELTRLKNRLDAFVEQHRDLMVEHDENTAYIKELIEEGKNQGLLEIRGLVEVEVKNLSAEQTHALEALRKKIRDVRASDPPEMFDDQPSIMTDYGFKVVDSFWQDLLTQAAQQQGYPAPVFDTPTGDGYVKLKLADDDEPQVYPEGLASFLNHPEHVALRGSEVNFQTLERQRRVQSNDALRISDVRTEYVAHVEAKYDKKNTQRKWIRAVDRFIELIGDVPLREIDAVTPHTFADEQVKARSKVSNKSIADYHMGVSLMLKFCVRKGYIRRNKFSGVSVNDYGKKTVSWLAYEPSEMLTIFDHEWSTQERLLLCIIATTGMRLSEAGMLTWERFNDTEYDGVRYFTLLDTGEEIVSVKNEGSSRQIPIHPDLKLPAKGTGRLFDYTVDENGLCSSSAGDKINPELNKLVPHIRKSAHSFRRTLKKMLRDVGVSKEINDEITGHRSGDVAGDVYGGTSIPTRAEAISKLNLSWLKQ
jgi:integrase